MPKLLQQVRCQALIEQLEARQLLAGFTLVTHGWQSGSSFPGWVDVMADAIDFQIPGLVGHLPLLAEDPDGVSGVGSLSLQDAAFDSGEYIATLNWVGLTSVVLPPYYSTADIASWTVDSLIDSSFGRQLLATPLHFIGHSRGGSLVYSLAAQLGEYGIWVDQVTLLDPYPVSVNDDEPLAAALDNVRFMESYYQQTGYITEALITGQPVPGAINISLDGISGSAIGHKLVHTYYHGTIDTTAAENGDGATIDPAWYTSWPTGPRDQVGFAWSRLGGLRPASWNHLPFSGGPNRTVVPAGFGLAQWPNVAGLALSDSTVLAGESLSASFAYGDRDSGVVVTLRLDDDDNPYNGDLGQIGQAANLAQAAFGLSSININTSGLAPGSYRLMARVTDGGRTRYEYLSEDFVVQSRPSVQSVTLSSPVLLAAGGAVTASITGAADLDGAVAFADFYIDQNGNGVIDPSADYFLGRDTAPANGWSVVFQTNNWSPGGYQVLARVGDDDGLISQSVTTPFRINRQPQPGTLVAPAVATGGTGGVANIVLTGASDPDGAVARVSFFRDNGNGAFDNSDALIATDTDPTGGFAAQIDLSVLSTGTLRLFGVAFDNDGVASAASTAIMRINARPTVASLAVRPGSLVVPGKALRLTASSPLDVDGWIARVDFFRDDGDGAFDEQDVLLGSDVSPRGGYSISGVSTVGWLPGAHRFFAVAVDTDGARSLASAPAVLRINAAPSLGALSMVSPLSLPLNRLNPVTLTVSDAADDVLVRAVRLFRDSNGNGIWDSRDRAIGYAAAVGGGRWEITIGPKKLPLGGYKLFARAQDSDKAWSSALELPVLVS